MSQATMKISQQSPPAQWSLPAGMAARLDIGPGVRELQVTQGRLWLTREGSARALAEDLWLSAGESLVLESGSEWVVEGWNVGGRGTCFQLLVPPSACRTWARQLSACAQVSSSSSRRRFWFWPVPTPG